MRSLGKLGMTEERGDRPIIFHNGVVISVTS
jgi:hypothetical protein